MNHPTQKLENKLEEIKTFLASIQGEVTTLEDSYSEVLHLLKNLEQRLENSADCDDLTGLLRRKPFFRKWQNLLNHCQTLGKTCSILMLDIDHFKNINDHYGHAQGDAVIKRVSALLKTFSTPECIIGRFGGEEFIVATLSEASNSEAALALGEKIRKAIEDTSRTEAIPCTVSIGVSSTIEEADTALYQAKRSGRNKVCQVG